MVCCFLRCPLLDNWNEILAKLKSTRAFCDYFDFVGSQLSPQDLKNDSFLALGGIERTLCLLTSLGVEDFVLKIKL